MPLHQIEPHLRFAASLRYEIPYNRKAVKVADCRIFFVIQGSAQVTIHSRCYDLEPSSLFYCNAGSVYTVYTREGFSLISLNFDLSLAHCDHKLPISPVRDPKKWDTMPIYAQQVEDSSFLNTHLFLSNGAALRETVERIATDFAATDPLDRLLCGQKLKLLLLELHRVDQTPIPNKVRTVREYIQLHYAEKITNKTLADLVGYHEYHLNRIFSACTGMKLHEYLLSVRLERAKELILNSDTSLQEISQQVGFGSYSHFSSYFKQTYLYSPVQYRKQLRGYI